VVVAKRNAKTCEHVREHDRLRRPHPVVRHHVLGRRPRPSIHPRRRRRRRLPPLTLFRARPRLTLALPIYARCVTGPTPALPFSAPVRFKACEEIKIPPDSSSSCLCGSLSRLSDRRRRLRRRPEGLGSLFFTRRRAPVGVRGGITAVSVTVHCPIESQFRINWRAINVLAWATELPSACEAIEWKRPLYCRSLDLILGIGLEWRMANLSPADLSLCASIKMEEGGGGT